MTKVPHEEYQKQRKKRNKRLRSKEEIESLAGHIGFGIFILGAVAAIFFAFYFRQC